MTQTQQRSLISIVFIVLIAGLIISLNVDNQDAQPGVSGPMGNFFKPYPSRAKAGFKKSLSE
jgi:hypothetical protein